MKKAHKLNTSDPQPLRATPAETRHGAPVAKREAGGVKECPARLREIIRLANLVETENLPDKFSIGIAECLPDALRLELLQVWTNPKSWMMSPQEWIDLGGFPRWTIEQASDFLRSAAANDHYALIRGSRAALIAVTSGAEVFPVTTFLKRLGKGKEARATYGGDPISDALFEAELFYIRRCEECGKFFYAQRENQETCPPESIGKPSLCAGKRRSRKKRENDKLKQRLKRKRA